LYRRALARGARRNHDGAVEDLEKAAELAPSDGLVAAELKAARARAAERMEREKMAYKKFFD